MSKAKENQKPGQGILDHSRIYTTLDPNADEDVGRMIAAQNTWGSWIRRYSKERQSNKRVGELAGWIFWCHSFQLTQNLRGGT